MGIQYLIFEHELVLHNSGLILDVGQVEVRFCDELVVRWEGIDWYISSTAHH
jgi:hypothetical protein